MSNRPAYSGWADDPSDEDDDSARLLKDPVRTYEATVRDHERNLDQLGQGVKRLKHVANEIAVEVDIHNEILDDIDTGLANTNENLRKNTRNIKLVTQKSSTCCLWFIIVILAAVIVLLAIL